MLTTSKGSALPALAACRILGRGKGQQPLQAAAQDTSWLDVYLSDIPHVVYHNADPADTQGAQHKTLMNKGNEAMGYLQFIVDYYDRLPASIAFIHGHRWAA